ncbi:hypothetical protein ACT2CC_00670 [Candidatus Vidania fulgoroideorum]
MKILLLLSGGVDSAYCLIRNSKIGYKNIYCLYIKIWHNNCKYKKNIKIIFSLKKIVKFKLIILNLEKLYYKNVFKPFIKSYKNGYTPNCDIYCNEKIKFKYLNFIIKNKQIKKIYTGHYAIIYKNNIFCSKDYNKDQSFFLCRTKFNKVRLPLGYFLKKNIIFLANFINIKFAKSSRGICFIEKSIKEIFKNDNVTAKVKYKNKKIGYDSFFKTNGQKIFIKRIYYIYNKVRKLKILNVCKNIDSPLLLTKFICLNKIYYRINFIHYKIKTVYIKIRNTSKLDKAFMFYYKKNMYINFVKLQKNVSIGQIISVYNKNKMLILCGIVKYTFNKGYVNY